VDFDFCTESESEAISYLLWEDNPAVSIHHVSTQKGEQTSHFDQSTGSVSRFK
jgi:hypothetical protein